ncbi:prepilin peptidase [Salicibibacter cibi]|uniref:Prepilin peptidase n=1 Tax=Salicibibacter cibi TaxID=2743001 RepID=A0A7T6ZD85_9BACI|nr:prepilin peptidase [Salicibibacter cibi]QQK81383.1 prepilin peptidase [Salicibibacter cibi]
MLSLLLLHAPFVLIILFSVVTDLKKRLIYDKVTLPGMLYFLLFHAIFNLPQWHMYVLAGLVLGGIHLLLAIVSKGQIGGGDIKLFTLIGFAIGWDGGFSIFIYTYLIAGLLALPFLIYIKFFRKREKAVMMPMAPFIALGVITFYLGESF